MNQLFMNYPIAAYVFLGVVFGFAAYLFVKEMQRLGLEKIRGMVYRGFIEAENRFKHGDNERKFEYVVALARENIPAPFNAFISVKLLKVVVQAWFDLVKDLLDDGRINQSSKVKPKGETKNAEAINRH